MEVQPGTKATRGLSVVGEDVPGNSSASVDGRDGFLGGMKRALCWSVSPQMPCALGMTSVQSRDVCAEKVLLSSSQAVGLSQVLAVCSAL